MKCSPPSRAQRKPSAASSPTPHTNCVRRSPPSRGTWPSYCAISMNFRRKSAAPCSPKPTGRPCGSRDSWRSCCSWPALMPAERHCPGHKRWRQRQRNVHEALLRANLILLDNSIKYTPIRDEEGASRVIVSLERTRGQAVLCVRDTGIGIDPTDLPHIFERFYRADRARSSQGTGLGLSIAQTFVEQLGGRITAESIPGKGI